MKHIKFSRCPIKPHKGERWKKIDDITNKDKPLTLVALKYMWSDDFAFKGIEYKGQQFDMKTDTYPDIDIFFWRKLMYHFYQLENIIGIALIFKVKKDHYITTFRAYDPHKQKYYENNIGNKFHIKEID